ncbi:MAG TPA: SRPBCC family protein [Mycobacteriales bacterium]|nr:SRPBCC family protein [Mycobacteriales bacterium]
MSRTRQVADSIVIAAPPGAIFDILADPRQHPRIDGSGSVREVSVGPDRLSAGARFGMRMRRGAPYRVTNVVLEFEPDRRIAWRHFGRHVWRYELEPVDGGTRVTETFDWSPSPMRALLDRTGVPRQNARAITATLQRLKDTVEEGTRG